MKPPAFSYYSPKDLDTALALMSKHTNAKLLAGGQSLMPMLNMRFVFPDNVIDLKNIAGLDYIRSEGDSIAIGAMTRHREIEHSDLLKQRCPLFVDAIRHVGHVQIRNWGTIGGSLCHLDPAAELPVVAQVVDATIHVQSSRGKRAIPMADFPAFYMTPAIEMDEIVTSVTFTPWHAGHGWGFAEFARRPGDFAVVSAAALIELSKSGIIKRVSLVLGGIGVGPVRCSEAEDILTGGDAVSRLREAAASCEKIKVSGDAQASEDYRRHLAGVLALRALETAVKRAQGKPAS